MKPKFILALAFLVGAAMMPCVAHAQDQNSSTTSTTTSKAKSKASKAAKNAANDTSAAGRKAASATEGAASSAKNGTAKAATATKNAAGNGANSAKNAVTNGRAAGATTQSATPPSPGMVWVNTTTKVYHTSGSRFYGKTKTGKWMSVSDAQKAGYKQASN